MEELSEAPAEPNELEDLLTGLYNRRYWTEHYPGLMEWATREHAPLSVGFIQCDTLLEVNARFAHSDGNVLLGLLADILNDSSLPAENYVPVRYAGDRFGVLMPGLSGREAVEQLEAMADRVRQTSFELPGGAHATTLSVGVAGYPDDAANAADIVGLAEKSLDLAVRSGRDRVCSPLDLAHLALDPQNLHVLFPTARLFGRRTLLDHLLAGLDTPGKQPVRLVYGPRGSGTSRIIAEVHRATKKRLDVCDPILLRCLPFLMAQPFGALVEGLQLAVSHDPRMREQMLSRLSSAQRAALVRVLPQWSRYSILATDAEEAPVDDPLVQLEEIFACMLLAIAEPPRSRRPALLVEDAQWLDPQTLHVIERVSERCYAVLATRSHDDTAGNNVVLQTTLQRLHDSNAFESHALEPLTLEDVTAWMHEVLPRLDLSAGTAAYIHQRSHGLPLLFEEIVRFLIHANKLPIVQDRVKAQPLGPDMIPANLPDLMFGPRLALDEQMVRVLALGALLGRPFSVEDVAALDPELAPGRVGELLKGASQVRVENELYRFVSDSASQSFLATLPPQEQRRLHSAVAELEESRSAGAGRSVAAAARIAYHWRAAGEPERATAALAQIDAAAEGEAPNLPPLSVDQVARTLATLRSMRLAVHDLRNSAATAVSERIHIAMEELSILLAEIRSVSIAPAAGGVLLNGRQVPYPTGAGRRLLEEFSLDLAQSHITSLTLHVGLTGDELRTALKLMAGEGPPDWESALMAANVRHLQINKRLETVRSSRASVRRLLGVEGEAIEGRDLIRNTLLATLARLDAVARSRAVEGYDADRLTTLLSDSRAMLEEAIDLVREP